MKHILIIDDDVYIGNMLQEVLEKEGYQVSRAYSGTEAVLSLSLARPDLVLLDLMLPGLSGEEVLPKIKGIPVIIVSAKVDVDNKVKLLLDGAVDYTLKDKIVNGKPYVEQGIIAGCAGGGFENICAAADILKGKYIEVGGQGS